MLEYPTNWKPELVLPFAVLVLFLLGFFGQMYYLWVHFRKLAFFKGYEPKEVEEPVSVVVCARNEYSNLKKNLPALLDQDYSNFEVIVVNDSSDDDTKELLRFYENQYGNLKVVLLERNLNFFQGKKFPLALGIKSASNEIILLTDADCKPSSNQWIRNMQANYNESTDIVLGYGSYEKGGGLLNTMIRWDAFHIAIQYLSLALSGKAYMGVGRNLSYRRKLFYDEKGFTGHYKISSGDDDLFINRVANKKNTRIDVGYQSHTVSAAKKTVAEWIHQKKRHFTTSKYYKTKFKRILGFYTLSKLLLYVSFITLVVINYNMIIAGPALAFVLLSQVVLFKMCANKLDEKDIVFYSVFFDIFMVLINPLIYMTNLLSKPDKWK